MKLDNGYELVFWKSQKNRHTSDVAWRVIKGRDVLAFGFLSRRKAAALGRSFLREAENQK